MHEGRVHDASYENRGKTNGTKQTTGIVDELLDTKFFFLFQFYIRFVYIYSFH